MIQATIPKVATLRKGSWGGQGRIAYTRVREQRMIACDISRWRLLLHYYYTILHPTLELASAVGDGGWGTFG